MRYLFLVLMMFATLLPRSALAHRVGVFAWVEGDRVIAEGYYAGGTRCGNCRVTVTDHETGARIVEGTTTEHGTFSFRLPSAGEMEIAMSDGKGHGGHYMLKKASPEKAAEALGAHLDSAEDMEALLDEKLSPVREELRRLRNAVERPGVAEILGGIGYIMGLLGLATYIRYRKLSGGRGSG